MLVTLRVQRVKRLHTGCTQSFSLFPFSSNCAQFTLSLFCRGYSSDKDQKGLQQINFVIFATFLSRKKDKLCIESIVTEDSKRLYSQQAVNFCSRQSKTGLIKQRQKRRKLKGLATVKVRPSVFLSNELPSGKIDRSFIRPSVAVNILEYPFF